MSDREPTEEELALALQDYGMRAQVDGIGPETVDPRVLVMSAGSLYFEGLVDCGWHPLRRALESALDHPTVRQDIFKATAPLARKIKEELFDDEA